MATAVAVFKDPQGSFSTTLCPTQPHLRNVLYPRIEAKFCLDSYLLREAILAATRPLNASLPYGLPPHIASTAVWCPKSFKLDDITYRVSATDIEELELALKNFNGNSQ